jgi:hypothetical protein
MISRYGLLVEVEVVAVVDLEQLALAHLVGRAGDQADASCESRLLHRW